MHVAEASDLSFIRISTLPASSLAFASTTPLAISSKFVIIFCLVISSISNPESEVEKPDLADSVSRFRRFFIVGQVSLLAPSKRASIGPVKASFSFSCKLSTISKLPISIQFCHLQKHTEQHYDKMHN